MQYNVSSMSVEHQPRICIAGAGAVGTLLCGVFGNKYEKTMTVIAHDRRAESFQKNGIILNSDFYGRRTVHPMKICEKLHKNEIQDYIFVCVKNYSINNIAETFKAGIGADTVIVPVMNGVDPGKELRGIFPDVIVADSLIYTVTSSEKDFSARQLGKYTYMFVGSMINEPEFQNGARRLYETIKASGFDVRWSDDIESEIWQKYILNCAFNTITARYLTTSGIIRKNSSMKSDLKELLEEGFNVGKAEGVNLPENLVDIKYSFMTEKQSEDATSSMKRDIEAGNRTELEAFLGTLVKKAKADKINVPAAERYYKEIKEIEKRNTTIK